MLHYSNLKPAHCYQTELPKILLHPTVPLILTTTEKIKFFTDYILPPITLIHSFNKYPIFLHSKSSLPVTPVLTSFKIPTTPPSLQALSPNWNNSPLLDIYLLISHISCKVQYSEHFRSTNWMRSHRYSKKLPSWLQHTPFPSLISLAHTLWATQLAPVTVTPRLSSIIGKGVYQKWIFQTT